MGTLRYAVRVILRSLRLLPLVRRLRDAATALISPTFRREVAARRQDVVQFTRAHGPALRHRLSGRAPFRGKALVAGLGFEGGVKIELGLIKALELAGYEPVVVNRWDPWLRRYYRLAGVRQILFWDDVLPPLPRAHAHRALKQIAKVEELLSWTWSGVRLGRFAAATALRQLRVGSLDLDDPTIRHHLESSLAEGMACAMASQRILQAVRPQLALVVDRGYTPQGELFDLCLKQGVDVVAWYAAHKSNALILKRYTPQNQDEHYSSLSAASWELIRQMEWTPAHRQQLQQELYGSYASGDWHSEVGTQFNKRLLGAEELRRRLGLRRDRKTAVIFPHILWDGTFFWGTDLFRSYEEWLVETVRAACADPAVNWVIKVHPANVVKDARDGLRQEPAELAVLRKAIGPLPPHVVVIPHDSDVSTFSLFGVMDYGVTVRGTVGIEAASLGIPVLTAGTGRYDRKGFTIDSDSREEYLSRLIRIQDIPPLSPLQRELAERFAYGILLLRPLPLTTLSCEYQRDATATCQVRIHAVTKEDWLNAQDLKAFAAWVATSREEDFLLMTPPRQASLDDALVSVEQQ